MTWAPDSWRQGGHSPMTTGQGHKLKDISPVAVAWRYNVGIIFSQKVQQEMYFMILRKVWLWPFPATMHHKTGAGKHPGEGPASWTLTVCPHSCGPFPGPSSDAHTHSGWPCTYTYMHQIRMVETGVARKKKCTSANTHGRYFLDVCLKGVNPAKMTYLPALSFVAWNEDMMARAKAAILDQEVFFAMDAKF